MIERQPDETDTAWIGRLEAAYRALVPGMEKLRAELDAKETECAHWAFDRGGAYGKIKLLTNAAWEMVHAFDQFQEHTQEQSASRAALVTELKNCESLLRSLEPPTTT